MLQAFQSSFGISGFFRKQRLVVCIGILDNVSQESCVWFGYVDWPELRVRNKALRGSIVAGFITYFSY